MGRNKDLALGELEEAVLMEFWQDARDEDGWFRHGVRGWRHPGEMIYRLEENCAGERIVVLKRAGLLTATTIQVGRRQFLYRISSAGAHRIAPGQPFVRPLPQPGRETFFLREIEWTVLQAYRDALADRSVPVRWGVRGWLRAAELRARVSDYRCSSYATATLARIGLLDQRRPRGTPTLYSRVTPAGLRLRVVERQWTGADRMDEIEVGDLLKLGGIQLLDE